MGRRNLGGGAGTSAGEMASLFGLAAGMLAMFWWIAGSGGRLLDVLAPPLAGALVGWALWRLEYQCRLPPDPRPLPLRVRRFPPDLPRGVC